MGDVLRGCFEGRVVREFRPGDLVSVMSSAQARSYHWLRIRDNGEPPLAPWNRALCGTRPGGWGPSWWIAEEEIETRPPVGDGDWRYAPQVPACERCEVKRRALP